MLIRSHKITPDTFATMVENIGTQTYAGNLTADRNARSLYADGSGVRTRVMVRSSREPGARRSWEGRRLAAACWHAYRDALLAVFSADPDAVVVTAMARYEGLTGFLATYPGTAHKNVGSMMQPAFMPELCDCHDDAALRVLATLPY